MPKRTPPNKPSKPPKPETPPRNPLVVASALVASGAALAAFGLSSGRDTTPSGYPDLPVAYRKYNEVERIQWDYSKTYEQQVHEIVSRNQAVVIENGPTTTVWSAVQRWADPAYVAQHVPKLSKVRHKASSMFINEQKSAFNKIAMDKDLIDDVTEAEMDLFPDEFFDHDPVHGNGLNYYYAATMKMDFASLIADVQPFSFFRANSTFTNTDSGLAEDQIKDFVPYVWMTHGGNAAAAHFDVSYNFNVQIKGHKRFLLMPVQDWPSLHLYPSFHLSRRQSQLDFRTLPDPNQFPLFNPNANVSEVVLSPGEILYVPPYLFHSVQTLDFCINVNFFTDFQDISSTLNELLRPEVLKLGLSQHAKRFPHILAAYMARMIIVAKRAVTMPRQRLCDGRTWSAEDLQQQGIARQDASTQEVQQLRNFLELSQKSRMQPLYKRIRCDNWTPDKCPRIDYRWDHVPDDLLATGDDVVETLAKAVQKETCKGTLDPDSLELWFSDWVEMVVARNLGVEQVCMYLRCFIWTLGEDIVGGI